MHHPKIWRQEIVEDCCYMARELLAADRVGPATVLEFMRGDVVSLRGTARAFASRMFSEKGDRRPRHVRYDPLEAERLADLKVRGRPPVRNSE
jgi:hypothetical protein